MSTSQAPLVEGIFAINKPSDKSSGQLVRDIQTVFNRSSIFAPLLEADQANRELEANQQRKRRKLKNAKVKVGHGGTLDPMATGVMIIGVGKGTKRLQSFLECTKSYESTVLFGAATDMYDTEGKVLKRAPYDHVTRHTVEEALPKFKGKIMQRPPIYSALKMNGKRLCDYAREGKEIPRKVEERPVEVKELEIVDWLGGGNHDFSVRDEKADSTTREVAESVLQLDEKDSGPISNGITGGQDVTEAGSKRKRSLDDLEDEVVKNKRPALSQETDPNTLMSGGLQPPLQDQQFAASIDGSSAEEGSSANDPSSQRKTQDRGRPPAVKLRMTVTSGFYVRSLAHDLGEAVGSLACMCALVRTRQGDHELGRNVLQYEDIGKSEAIWGPKVRALIENAGRPV